MTVHVIGSVIGVTQKLIELNKTCMDAILKALPIVMNENRGNKVFTVIQCLSVYLKMRENGKDTYFSLNYYIHVIVISPFPPSLTSCILNVVDRQQTVRQRHSNVPALIIERLHWKSRTGYEEIFP